jgi:hypothetical protein
MMARHLFAVGHYGPRVPQQQAPLGFLGEWPDRIIEICEAAQDGEIPPWQALAQVVVVAEHLRALFQQEAP